MPSIRSFTPRVRTLGVGLVAFGLLWVTSASPASAATPVVLGTAAPFAVLAGTAVTDVPTSVITGDVGLSPAAGSNYAGLTKSEVTGSIYAVDATGPGQSVNDAALLTTAKNDLTTAFGNAAGRSATTTFVTGDNQLGGKTLTAGVYAFGHATTANISAASPLTLNGQGDPNSVFIFQASSDLVTASSSVVQLENGAQACNVFWEVGSSATLSTASTFVGTLMALTSATLDAGATVQGRILAQNGQVSLDSNVITVPTTCATTTGTTGTSGATGTTGTGTGTTGTGAGNSTLGAGATGSSSLGASSGSGALGSQASTAVTPLGAPHTGFGGSSNARSSALLPIGVIALLGAGASATIAMRRRHSLRGAAPTET